MTVRLTGELSNRRLLMLPYTARARTVMWMGIVLFLATEIWGCSSSRLVNVWRDPEYHGTLTNVFVVAVKRDPTLRRIWEDGLVSALGRHGVTATPSYRLFPRSLPDTTQVIDAVREHQFDGFIVTVRLPSETDSSYVQGYITTVPVIRYDPWWQVYRTYYQRVYQPGYYETQTVARARTDIWIPADRGTLIWTGTSDVFDPTSSQAVSHEINEMIVPELAEQKLISAKAKG
jgi:hypothetical protein